jgi:hypothetical protein
MRPLDAAVDDLKKEGLARAVTAAETDGGGPGEVMLHPPRDAPSTSTQVQHRRAWRLHPARDAPSTSTQVQHRRAWRLHPARDAPSTSTQVQHRRGWRLHPARDAPSISTQAQHRTGVVPGLALSSARLTVAADNAHDTKEFVRLCNPSRCEERARPRTGVPAEHHRPAPRREEPRPAQDLRRNAKIQFWTPTMNRVGPSLQPHLPQSPSHCQPDRRVAGRATALSQASPRWEMAPRRGLWDGRSPPERASDADRRTDSTVFRRPARRAE